MDITNKNYDHEPGPKGLIMPIFVPCRYFLGGSEGWVVEVWWKIAEDIHTLRKWSCFTVQLSATVLMLYMVLLSLALLIAASMICNSLTVPSL